MSALSRPSPRLHSESRPTVLVIGGGATGTGIAAEAARRGFRVTLIERGELGSGTSGHFHGILHSGARYAVNDPVTATECYQENQLLRVTIPSAIRNTGGLAVAITDADMAHADTWLRAVTTAGIPVQEISSAQALQREPQLNPTLQRAFIIPDGFIDGAEVIRLSRRAAETAAVPASFHTHTSLLGLHLRGGRITQADVRNTRTGEAWTIDCDFVINAAGVWAGSVAALAGVPLHMVYDKGTMITFRQHLTSAIINRCRPEADGDLLVASPGGSIMGTTSRVIPDPDDCLPTQEEVDALLTEGAIMVPAMARAEATYIYAGVRPLFTGAGQTAGPPAAGTAQANAGPGPSAASTRAISRSFRVLDHAHEGPSNFISIVGGKVTLYRRMAAATVDALALKSGWREAPAAADRSYQESR